MFYFNHLMLVIVFLAGAVSVIVMCESKPRSWMPAWLAAPMEVAGAVRTLTYHRGLVQQIESWVGMPILVFGAALPPMIAVSVLNWAFPSRLRQLLPFLLAGKVQERTFAQGGHGRHYRSLKTNPTLQSSNFLQHDLSQLMIPVPM